MKPTSALRSSLGVFGLSLTIAAGASIGCVGVNRGTPGAPDGAVDGGVDVALGTGTDVGVGDSDAGVPQGRDAGGATDGGGSVDTPACPAGPANTFYLDADRDGFGAPERPAIACEPPANHVDNDRDCDDTNAARKPGSCTPGTPTGLSPTNGHYTGSLHAAAKSASLRPELKWAAVPGARRYEVQIDDGCVPGQLGNCDFGPQPDHRAETTGTSFRPTDDLAVSRTAPVGKRHYWRVRACFEAECSAWTRVRHLEVGRVEKDFNGDGYADLVMGASYTLEWIGRAYLLFGRPGLEVSSAAPEPVRATVTLAAPVDQDEARFGETVSSAGDVNGDGFGDVVVGAAGTNLPPYKGRAYLFFGKANLGAMTGAPVTTSLLLSPPSDQEQFYGAPVADAGDMNGDGLADLLVSVAGRTCLFLGKVGLEAPTADPLAPSMTLGPGGLVTGAGDVNGDGLADALVGAPGTSGAEGQAGAGRAHLFFGKEGLGSASVTPLPSSLTFAPPVDQEKARFGSSVANAGDLNGDGFDDLIIGAPPSDTAAANVLGRAYLFFGRAGLEGWGSSPVRASLTLVPPSDQRATDFAYEVASAGDINADGFEDVLVGVSSSNRTYLYFGKAGLEASSGTPLGASLILSPPPSAVGKIFFGRSVAPAGDVNGDGVADVVVGDSGITLGPQDLLPYVGRAYLFFGKVGFDATSGPPLTLAAPVDRSYDEFGTSLARLDACSWRFAALACGAVSEIRAVALWPRLLRRPS